MPAANHNLQIDQGATFSITIKVLTSSKLPIDLTGYTARAQIRENMEDTDVLGTFTVTVADAENGVLKMEMDALTTSQLRAVNSVYDLEIESGGGQVTRLMRGKVTISPEVTR